MVYDAMKVNVIIDGVAVTAFATGSMVEAVRNEDRVIPYFGVKGEWAMSINNNNSGTITITLQQGSPMNAILQRKANNKETFPVEVTDVNEGGKFRAGGTTAIILNEPAISRGPEIAERAWAIFVFDYSAVET